MWLPEREKGFDDLEQAGTAREEDFPANITNDQEVMEAAHLLRAFDPTLEAGVARHVAEGAIGYLPFVIEERIESPPSPRVFGARALIEAAYWLAMAKRDSEIPAVRGRVLRAAGDPGDSRVGVPQLVRRLRNGIVHIRVPLAHIREIVAR